MSEGESLFDLEKDYDKYISFKNGLYNLDTDEFRPRCKSDKMTLSLDYDYTLEFDTSAYQDILEFFKKLQPNEEQRKFTISFLRYCLKGGNEQTKFKMNIGSTGANGKTSEMDLFHNAFGIYTAKLHRQSFQKNCAKLHKYLYQLLHEPIRLAYINELDESALDVAVLKDFTDDDARIVIEKMHNTMCANTRIQCKLITTSNRDPNFRFEDAFERRFLIQNYESRFVSPNVVDTSKHWYPIDRTWVKTRFEQDAYKLAFFHFLLKEGKFLPELVVPEVNLRLAKDTLNQNDEFLSTFNDHFVVTYDTSDKLDKHEVRKLFDNMSLMSLNTEMKKLGVTYDKSGKTFHTNLQRGIYRGIKMNTSPEEKESVLDERDDPNNPE